MAHDVPAHARVVIVGGGGMDMPRFDYDPKEGRLVFHLTKTVEDLFSEVPAARLKSLAQALGAKLDIRLTG